MILKSDLGIKLESTDKEGIMFYIGQKVVCIEGKFSECGVRLVEQKIYEIKKIDTDFFIDE